MSADLLNAIRRMWEHSAWADALLFDALAASARAGAAWVEYSHILGAEETWLSRLEGRQSRSAVWPKLEREQIASLRDQVVLGYETYLKTLDEPALSGSIEYTTSAGMTFQTRCADILVHVALHGQYHRGKINLLLRESGGEPAPVDYIGFVRGVPAATTVVSR
jgi:uncharacterized damage-inducible protein DinB